MTDHSKMSAEEAAKEIEKFFWAAEITPGVCYCNPEKVLEIIQAQRQAAVEEYTTRYPIGVDDEIFKRYTESVIEQETVALKAEVARLREALGFYGASRTWVNTHAKADDAFYWCEAASDAGYEARQALAATPEDIKRWAEVREAAVKVATAAETLKNLQPEKPH